MYLARMALNPTRRQTTRLLGSSQSMHALVMGSCGPDAGTAGPSGERVLWRVDESAGRRIDLYVLSPHEPDLTGAVEQAGWPTAHAWDCRPYTPLLERLSVGQRWRFRLTANPVRSKSVAGQTGSRGRVVPHLTRRHQAEWFLSHTTGWGFEVPTNSLEYDVQTPDGDTGHVVPDQLAISKHDVASFDRHTETSHGPQSNRVQITRVTYDGVLEVADADALRRSLVHGMGRAKAYGCGLMTLAPVS